MTQIGYFTAIKEGYSGRIQTLSLDAAVLLVPADRSENENAPDYRLLLGVDGDGPEIGAGWARVGGKAGIFIAVQIDDPTLEHPIRANLFDVPSKAHSHVLVWNRAPVRDEQA